MDLDLVGRESDVEEEGHRADAMVGEDGAALGGLQLLGQYDDSDDDDDVK